MSSNQYNDSRAHEDVPVSRRELLCRSGMGFAALGLSALLPHGGLTCKASGNESQRNPLTAKAPHFPAKAKHVIHVFMNGGPSQVDIFDPKPALEKYAGRMIPTGNLRTERRTGAAFPSPFKFRRFGQSGIEVSEIFSNVGSCIDDIAVIRSMHAEVPNHEPSLLLMNCGEGRLVRPSLGSWLTYGLGTGNENLPGFVAMCPKGYPIQDVQNWQSAFLPGIYQGTYVDSQHTEVDKLLEFIKNPHTSLSAQRRQLNLLEALNRRSLERRQGEADLDARINSFELAYRMQIEAADAFDVTREPQYVREMYGEDQQGRQMLIARRLVERGVRFVQTWHGESQPWDSHDRIEEQHGKLARECDRAIGALLKDLKQRGLLEETLVIWGGEFGRTPTAELPQGGNKGSGTGRDHNPYGFTVWMAGGGVKGGQVYGATDEFGFRAESNPVHVHDLHATILHLFGLDHTKLTFRYAGRDFRLTDVYGRVIGDIVA